MGGGEGGGRSPEGVVGGKQAVWEGRGQAKYRRRKNLIGDRGPGQEMGGGGGLATATVQSELEGFGCGEQDKDFISEHQVWAGR